MIGFLAGWFLVILGGLSLILAVSTFVVWYYSRYRVPLVIWISSFCLVFGIAMLFSARYLMANYP
jgi:hypothetical protein